jgi:hypothetical protein
MQVQLGFIGRDKAGTLSNLRQAREAWRPFGPAADWIVEHVSRGTHFTLSEHFRR